MQKLPFSLTIRGESPFYYVRFRNERTGKFMSWLSTKEKNYSRALRKAWDMYNEKADAISELSFYDTIRKSDYTKEDVQKFLEDFQRKGFLTSFVMNDSSLQNVDALEWLCSFWNPDVSEYLKEKARKGKPVHKKHRENSVAFITRHWSGILEGKKLGELSRADIRRQFDRLDALDLNGNTKNHILRSVLTPLKWAYNNELLPVDLSRGWVMYKCEYKKRIMSIFRRRSPVIRNPAL